MLSLDHAMLSVLLLLAPLATAAAPAQTAAATAARAEAATASTEVTAHPTPMPWTQVAKTLHPVAMQPATAKSPPLELRSDIPVPEQVKQRALVTVATAYEINRRYLNLPANSPAFKAPLSLGLASPAAAAGRGGFSTMGTRQMIGPIAKLDGSGPLDGYAAYAIGHETSHVLMNRAGGPIGTNKVPVYFGEGVATSLGMRYAVDTVGRGRGPGRGIAQQLATFTADDARQMFASFSVPADYKAMPVRQVGIDEHAGSLFVEFVQSRLVPGPNFFPRIGQMSSLIASGKDFSTAFETAMGVPLATAQEKFIAFMNATQNNPQARFAGTIYQGYL